MREPRNLYTVPGGAVIHASPHCRHLNRSPRLACHTLIEASRLGLRYCYDCEPEVVTARVERADQPLPAAQDVGGAPVDHEPERPSDRETAAVAATASTLRYVTGWSHDIDGIEYVEARDLIDAAEKVEHDGAAELCCPVCEEVGCDDDCPLAPYRNAR